MLDSDAARTDVAVRASAVIHEAGVAAVLDDLEERSTVAPAAHRPQAGSFLLAVLVLIAASGAAAVVYFALP